ncbi:MAG: AAA family ATPase [Proteobacteria bacterium]|nr:AAA family ATPase [Pseudomonadota bacterium]
MYTSFFGLSEKPFAITPDPRYLYLSERHAEALAHLLYGINESGGFIQLTGEVGTGKTTVVRTLLSRVPHHADVAVILNPRVSPAEFLLTICEELGILLKESERGSVKEMIDALNRRLLATHASGRRVIVIVDEAQNLEADVLEQVRLLTNLETATQKLLQIILIGQPELRELLARNDLRQLAQRITGRYHLHPLTREETKGYVRHRLRVAGATGEIFTPGALEEVYRISGGIPRVINVTCDRALLGAFTTETRRINTALVRRAAGEVYGRHFMPAWMLWSGGAAALLLLLVGGFFLLRHGGGREAAAGTAPAGSLVGKIAAPSAATVHGDAPGVATPAVADPAAVPASSTTSPTSAVSPTPASSSAGVISRGPPVASMTQLLSENAAETAAPAAYRRLLALWGKVLTSDKNPCAQAAADGLACLSDRGSWGQLRALNRPAILELSDDHGGIARVVLTGLDDDYATLALGEKGRRVALADISRYWMGGYTLVWKPKSGKPRELSAGMRGEQVQWLRRSLAAVRGDTSSTEPPDVYDQALVIAVQNFQREHRLTADGIAGLTTQVVLDTTLAEPGSPLLLPPPKRGS